MNGLSFFALAQEPAGRSRTRGHIIYMRDIARRDREQTGHPVFCWNLLKIGRSMLQAECNRQGFSDQTVDTY